MLQQSLFIIFLILFLIISSCRDNNSINGSLVDPTIAGDYTKIEGEQSGMLLKNKSPFFVSSNIIINSSDTLVIQKGIELFFNQETRLVVNGVLIVEGTKTEPVRLTAFDIDWEGIHIVSSSGTSTLDFCVFEFIYLPRAINENSGAIEITNSNVEIRNCYFKENYVQNGGGLAISNSSVIVVNSVFHKNTADNFGGAILSENSSNQIINNTFYKNVSYNFGGGIVIDNPVNEEIQNNIFFDNISYFNQGDPGIALLSGDTTNISEQYNFLAFGTMDPLFISTQDFHLQQISPCIDSGNPDEVFHDADGSRNDQGAYGGPGGDW